MCDHGTVSIGNKMFVISNVDFNDFEVFDSITNKFTLLKTNPHVCRSLKSSAITPVMKFKCL